MWQWVDVTRGRGTVDAWWVGGLYLALLGLPSTSPSPIKRPLRNSRAWGWDTPPIPLLRPFDSAHATADLRQGERNASPPGMERPYFVSGFGGRNDGYANETHQRAPKADVWLIKRPVRDYPFGAILARLDMLSNPELPALDSRLSASSTGSGAGITGEKGVGGSG